VLLSYQSYLASVISESLFYFSNCKGSIMKNRCCEHSVGTGVNGWSEVFKLACSAACDNRK
jgi:hypothetical protein